MSAGCDDLRWNGSLTFMDQPHRIETIIIDTQALKTISHKKESNYFSFYRIIRLFSSLRTTVITNDVLAFWHLGFSLNFFSLT